MPTPPRSPSDAFTARFLGRVPAELRASFTQDQLTAIQQAFGMRYTMDHALDIRRHVRLPGARYYLVLLCGRDFRPREPGRGRFFPHPAAMLAAIAAGIVFIVSL